MNADVFYGIPAFDEAAARLNVMGGQAQRVLADMTAAPAKPSNNDVVRWALEEALGMIEAAAREAFDVWGGMSNEDFAEVWLGEEPRIYRRYVRLLEVSKRQAETSQRFQNVSCSNCGESFGPGDSGYSECSSHAGLRAVR